MLVSVPCSCGAEVGPMDARCRACNAPVSSEQREALDAALEAAHSEFRDARQQVQRAATVLLVVGLIYVAFGLLSYLVSAGTEFTPLTQEESSTRVTALVENVVLGCALLGCYFAARRAPGRAFLVALGLWLANRLLVLAAAPATLFLAFVSAPGVALLMGRIVVLALLVRGLLAARRLNRIRADAARIPDQAEHEGAS